MCSEFIGTQLYFCSIESDQIWGSSKWQVCLHVLSSQCGVIRLWGINDLVFYENSLASIEPEAKIVQFLPEAI